MENLTKDPTVNIALDTLKLKKQALVFANSKRSAEKCAEDIAKHVKNKHLIELSDKVLKALSRPTKQCERLSRCILKGIAFHHAGLPSKQRDLIEDNFRAGVIKIICSTPTLAIGLDLPAFRVILKDLRRFGFRGLDWIPTLEYLQMCGRAGRPSYDTEGEAIAIASTENSREEIEFRYIYGQPEDIYSKLAVEPVLRTYVLSLIATKFVSTKKQLIDFFEKTFWAKQYKDKIKLITIIEKMINLLKDFDFIKSEKPDFVSANELEQDEKYTGTKMGERVAQLYIDPLTAKFIIDCLERSNHKKINAFSFLQMTSRTLEMRPHLRVKVKELEDIQAAHLKLHDFILEDEPTQFESEYEDFISSLKTGLLLQDWIDEKSEDELLLKYDVRPGELNTKILNSDWLLYASEEICRIMKKQSLLKEISKTRFRLKKGIKEELIPLLGLKKIGRMRARKLFENKLRNLGDLKKIDINTIAQLVGKNLAINIKEQLGQPNEKVTIKPNKRKGQISLTDWN